MGNINSGDYELLTTQGANGRFHKLTHILLESGLSKISFPNVLEVGSGDGEHVSYVKHSYDHYIASDIIEPKNLEAYMSQKISFVVADIEQLPFQDETFDRVIVTCVLHHIVNIDKAAKELRRVMKPGGTLSIMLPTDPGIVFRFSRKVFSDRNLKKLGIENISYLRAMEHRNHYLAIVAILRNSFELDMIRTRGFPFNNFLCYRKTSIWQRQ